MTDYITRCTRNEREEHGLCPIVKNPAFDAGMVFWCLTILSYLYCRATVPGSKIFTEIPRRRMPSAGISAARFAPRSPQSLAPPFRGAKSSQKFRAAAYLRPAFPRRDLLLAPRKALSHRPGEQNLHRNSAPPSAFGRHFRGAICSPLPARPCATVSGSKIFTEIPRRRLPLATFSAARFAPRPPQSLAASFRGAKSSQKFRAGVCPAVDHVGAAPPAKP